LQVWRHLIALLTELNGSLRRRVRLGVFAFTVALTGTLVGAGAMLVSLAPEEPAAPTLAVQPADMEIDRGLIQAILDHRGVGLDRAFLLSLDVEPDPAEIAEQLAPSAPPDAGPPVPPPPPPPPPLPPRVMGADALRSLLDEVFGEEAERAYRIVICESSGNITANTGNGYYGMWQFDLATWQVVGGAGLPSHASAEEQARRARMLYDVRGWSPWGCS